MVRHAAAQREPGRGGSAHRTDESRGVVGRPSVLRRRRCATRQDSSILWGDKRGTHSAGKREKSIDRPWHYLDRPRQPRQLTLLRLSGPSCCSDLSARSSSGEVVHRRITAWTSGSPLHARAPPPVPRAPPWTSPRTWPSRRLRCLPCPRPPSLVRRCAAACTPQA